MTRLHLPRYRVSIFLDRGPGHARHPTVGNKSAAVVIGALAFIFAPLQNAIAQSLSLDEISAIRERALVGKATQADKRRLYKSLSPEDAHGLLRFQGSSGNIRGASLYRTVVNAVAEVNGDDKQNF